MNKKCPKYSPTHADHTLKVGASVVGKQNKAAHAWVWGLVKAGDVAGWTWTKGEGFRVAWTEEVYASTVGGDKWGELAALDAETVMEWCAERDPEGRHCDPRYAVECGKFLSGHDAGKTNKRAGVKELRDLVGMLATRDDLPEDVRALLVEVAA